MRLGIGLLLSITMPIAGASDLSPAGRPIDWADEILPAILTSFCVQETAGGLVPSTVGCSDGVADPISDEITKAVERATTPHQWYLYALMDRIGARVDAERRPEREQAERKLRALIARDERLLRFVMPDVQRVLARENAVCKGCPEFEERPVRRKIKLDDVMSYASLLAWPDRILSNKTPAMHVCAAANGMSRIEDPDLLLAGAAIEAVSGNQWAIRRMSAALGHAKRTDEYRQAGDDDERIAILRQHVREFLRADPEFRSAVGNALLEKGSGAGVACEDCVAAAPPPPDPNARPVTHVVPKPFELEVQGLTREELHALKTRVPQLNFVLRGPLTVASFLNLVGAATNTKIRLVGDEHRGWRGIDATAWTTNTHEALVWLHNACGLRFAGGADGELVVTTVRGEDGTVRCSKGERPITPQ